MLLGRLWCVLRAVDGRLLKHHDTLMLPASDPRANHLLAALPDEERRRWSARLEASEMPLGAVLAESGANLSHVYFPTTAIVSLAYIMQDGSSAEIAVVGNEGLVGVSLFL